MIRRGYAWYFQAGSAGAALPPEHTRAELLAYRDGSLDWMDPRSLDVLARLRCKWWSDYRLRHAAYAGGLR